MLHVLAGAHLGWLAIGVLSAVFAILIRSQRWRVLLRPVAAVPFEPALSATAIGFGATAVMPLRLGEIVRPALLGRRMRIGLSPALSSVVVERLFDMLFVILCFLLLSLVYPVPEKVRGLAGLLAVGAFLGFAVLILMERYRAAAESVVGRLLGLLPARAGETLRPMVSGFLSGLGVLARLDLVAAVVFYSACLWTANALPFLFSILALGIDVPLLPAALASVVIVAAFVFLPQGPGFVGTWQAGCVLALGLFHVPQDQAVGFSLLTWMLAMTVNVGLGGLFLAREDLSVQQLVRGAPDTEGAR